MYTPKALQINKQEIKKNMSWYQLPGFSIPETLYTLEEVCHDNIKHGRFESANYQIMKICYIRFNLILLNHCI